MLTDTQFKSVRFHLASNDPRAYLCGRRKDGPAFTVEMSQSRPGLWFADVPLSEGTYHLRYYCWDGQVMTYYGPASSAGSWQEGLDAVVVVEAPVPLAAAMIAIKNAQITDAKEDANEGHH